MINKNFGNFEILNYTVTLTMIKKTKIYIKQIDYDYDKQM